MFKFLKSTATTSSEPKVTDKNLLGTQRGDPTIRKSENETNANSFTKKTISRPTRKGKRKRKPKAEFVEVHAEIKEILICVFDEQEEMAKLIIELLPWAWIGQQHLITLEKRAGIFEGQVRLKYRKRWDLPKEPEMHGLGIFTYTDGVYYEGQFKKDEMHGKGRMQWPDGAKFFGRFRRGKRCGHGKLELPQGDVYEGTFKNDDFHNEGKFTFANGEYYTGSWCNGKRQGYGEFYWPDGDVFKGYYHKGEMHGRGVYTFADGSTFDGNYQNGERHGHGLLTNIDGTIYDGNWDDGYKHGYGVEKSSDGTVYEGNWADGFWEGDGTCTRPDGTIQSGYWFYDDETGRMTLNEWDGGDYIPTSNMNQDWQHIKMSQKALQAC